MTPQIWLLVAIVGGMALFIGLITMFSDQGSLNGIKSKTVGDGQHGTARFATPKEIANTYCSIPFCPELWRKGEKLPKMQGVILGSTGRKGKYNALVDSSDVHTLMIGASGIGKTAFFLYPNLEYACASGISWLCTDTKGDLYRNYGGIAKEKYGYHVAVIDLRNPTRSDGNNMLHLVNKYMDVYKADSNNLSAKARAEKYARIIAKTIINTSGESTSYGQNQFFYDSAEGVLTAAILMIAEFCPPEKRHIVSVFKMIQDLLEPSPVKGKNQFQLLIERLPPEHKARWFAGAALNSADQAMASVLSTALSRLNVFLDSELEQILCFDTAVDAERFCGEKSAIFLVMPEENPVVYFLISLFIQQLYREILAVADEHGGTLPTRVMFYLDELGTLPPIQSLELLFSASRSRGLLMVPIIQSFGQLQKLYGREGAEIVVDNCQNSIFGAFAPNSESAQALSKALGSQTVLTGSVSKGKDTSRSLQMIERPLMTPDELKSLPKGQFVVMKTGTHPMKTKLPLFLDWGIRFGTSYTLPERAQRRVSYADRAELEREILKRHPSKNPESYAVSDKAAGGMAHTPVQRRRPPQLDENGR